jgi:hypothetical protein
MKKKKTNLAKSARKFRRRPLIIVTTIAVLAIAAITVVSRQLVSGKQTSEKATAAANAADKKFTKVKFAGQELPLDAKGQIRPLTPDEARQMADRLKGMLNRSTKGLVQEHKADGSTSMDLQDRFQHVTIARVNADGTVTTACVDNPQAAGAFLGIDPKLLQPDQQ